MKHKFVVEAGQGGRLDKFLDNRVSECSRAEIQANIQHQRARVNGATITKKGYAVSPGDKVEIEIPPSPSISRQAQNIPLDIRYQDEWLLVVNKPVNMVVHPAPGHATDTLVNALWGYGQPLSNLGGEARPGIVHRLDKDTSGLLIVAKTNQSHMLLSNMLKERAITRVYLALVRGHVKQQQGTLTGPVGRHPRVRTKMAVVETGKPAATEFKVLRHFPGHTLLQLKLLTGRTHQIRVHLSTLGHAVVGDQLYGQRQKKYAGHMLHARTLEFNHPILDNAVSVTAEPPAEFVSLLRSLHRQAQ